MGTLYGPHDARVYEFLGDLGVGIHTREAIRTIASTPNGLVILGSWFLDILEVVERISGDEYIDEPFLECMPEDELQVIINRVARNSGDWAK